MKVSKRIILAFASLAMMLCSCERRPLIDPENKVKINVKVNIKAIANVTSGIYNKYIPVPDLSTNMMRVMVYDPDTKELLTQSFISSKTVEPDGTQVLSGDIKISHGTYDFVVYNFDTPTTLIKNENNEHEITAYTSEISAALKAKYAVKNRYSSKSGAEEMVNYEPDHLVVARAPAYRISPHDEVVVIEAEARTIVDTYYIQIRVKGMQFASSASAIMSGMSPSNKFGIPERNITESSSLFFDLTKSKDPLVVTKADDEPVSDVLCATFNTFGKIESISSDLFVTFNVIDIGGNIQQKTINLDKAFQTEDAKLRHWLLIDDVWEIEEPIKPDPPSGGGGFQPQVGDWDRQEGDISL